MSEHWNGQTWSMRASPALAGSTGGVLLGVSCPSTKSCFAVGQTLNRDGVPRGFFQWWDGTWKVMGSTGPDRWLRDSFVDVNNARYRGLMEQYR